MANILIIRLSAIGDVAMTIPVIYSAAEAYPADTFTVLTQAFLLPLFVNKPPNVRIVSSVSVTHDYDKIIDLHNVISSRIIRILFRLKKTPVFTLDKNRKARKRLTAPKGKELKPLISMIDNYTATFQKAGFHFALSFTSVFASCPADLREIEDTTGKKSGKWIGIAPFAKHGGKIYPPAYMEQIVKELSKREDMTVFLFGGRGEEAAVLEQWACRYPRVKNMAGRYPLANELALISRLDLLVSMDSANMHFASLTATRVLSVWGATHPYAGFYGFRQNPNDAVQLDMPCRPCSAYGNKPCLRKDRACMTQLMPETIVEKIQGILEI
ncbi:Lipopolysaccharide core heptosyltransferase rfaQ [Bacteroidales bacterium Barb6]|nr:Lipopolysaccharide core heptosyltransferase rfaQ [Bacteroidales bacterium Barb6]